MSAAAQPPAKTIFPWLKVNLGNDCLGVLTGTDRRALEAAVQIVALWCYDSDDSVLEAFGIVVCRMQEKSRHLAYHAIAHVSDWSLRPKVWALARLTPIPVGRCACE